MIRPEDISLPSTLDAPHYTLPSAAERREWSLRRAGAEVVACPACGGTATRETCTVRRPGVEPVERTTIRCRAASPCPVTTSEEETEMARGTCLDCGAEIETRGGRLRCAACAREHRRAVNRECQRRHRGQVAAPEALAPEQQAPAPDLVARVRAAATRGSLLEAAARVVELLRGLTPEECDIVLRLAEAERRRCA